MENVRRWAERFWSTLFPRRCAACGRPVPFEQVFCDSCRAALPTIKGPTCPRCGRELADCRCGGRKTACERITAPFYYEGPARSGVWQVKFRGRRRAAVGFADVCAERVRREYAGVAFDFVLPVPMSKREQHGRGFNQAALFARRIARRLGLPCREDVLRKPLDTKPQRCCDAAQRWKNISGVFLVSRKVDLTGKTLLLVDDVTTTGATFDECARQLRNAGAKAVYAVAATAVRPRAASRQTG